MASSPTLPKVGDTLVERFTLRRILGEGGMGIVFEAFDAHSERPCALKILFPHFCDQPNVTARFDREARVAAKLKGPNVARIFDVGALPTGLPYIAMELLVGRDLATELIERERLPVSEAVDIVVEACAAMSEAHALGVVHRDLKPANLFLAHDPARSERPVVKVLDFGISRLYDDERRLTTDFSPLGTAVYMSPEQIESAARVDERTDVWALGIVLYELLVGHPPFDGQGTAVLVAVATKPVPPPSSFVEIPSDLEAVIMHALEKSPDERFQNMEELARALAPWASTKKAPRQRRSRMRVALIALVVVVAVGVAATSLDLRPTLPFGEESDLASASVSSSASTTVPARRASATASSRRPPAPHGSQPHAGTAHPSSKPR